MSQKRDFKDETDSVLSTVKGFLDDLTHSEVNTDVGLQVRWSAQHKHIIIISLNPVSALLWF